MTSSSLSSVAINNVGESFNLFLRDKVTNQVFLYAQKIFFAPGLQQRQRQCAKARVHIAGELRGIKRMNWRFVPQSPLPAQSGLRSAAQKMAEVARSHTQRLKR